MQRIILKITRNFFTRRYIYMKQYFNSLRGTCTEYEQGSYFFFSIRIVVNIQLFIKLHFKSIQLIHGYICIQYMIKCITVYRTLCILTCYISCYYLIMPFCINKRRGIANAEFFFNIYGFCLYRLWHFAYMFCFE